jgi:hypothetical protein
MGIAMALHTNIYLAQKIAEKRGRVFKFRDEKKFYKICTNNGKCFLERGCLVRMISCLQIKKRAMIRMEREREKEKGREGERKKRGEREREKR